MQIGDKEVGDGLALCRGGYRPKHYAIGFLPPVWLRENRVATGHLNLLFARTGRLAISTSNYDPIILSVTGH